MSTIAGAGVGRDTSTIFTTAMEAGQAEGWTWLPCHSPPTATLK